jgi:hypothetical protein
MVKYLGMNPSKRSIVAGFICLFLLTSGTIIATAAIQTPVHIFEKNSDQVQHLFIIGSIKNIDTSGFNLIFFYGESGFYLSVGWKGGSMGRIKNMHFTIYENSFHGCIIKNFILGTAIQQSGPFYIG